MCAASERFLTLAFTEQVEQDRLGILITCHGVVLCHGHLLIHI